MILSENYSFNILSTYFELITLPFNIWTLYLFMLTETGAKGGCYPHCTGEKIKTKLLNMFPKSAQ